MSEISGLIMSQEGEAVSWNMFFVFLAGNTNGAHLYFVEKLKRYGQTEVNSPKDCDYVLVFCPVASRVGTDVSEAVSRAPAGEPIILVVMHHTFNPDHVVAESSSLVSNLNVLLTVDCLFHEDKLLNPCSRNDAAWHQVETFLRLSQVSLWSLPKMVMTFFWTWGWWIFRGSVFVAVRTVTRMFNAVLSRIWWKKKK